MSDEKDKVLTGNQIPINKDKLKEEQKVELKAGIEAYEQWCLPSFSTNKSGEVIKKYDFPTLPPYDEAQKEDRMEHMVNQAVEQAFINHMLRSWLNLFTILCSRRCKKGDYLV